MHKCQQILNVHIPGGEGQSSLTTSHMNSSSLGKVQVGEFIICKDVDGKGAVEC